MKKWNYKELVKGEKIKYFLLFISIFCLNIFFAIQMRGALFSDEIGHLSSVEYLIGNDWSEYVDKIGLGYYKYGATILYTPLYLLFHDRTQLYVAMITFNSGLLALVPCIIYMIEKKYLNVKNESEALLIAFTLGVMPASLILGKSLLSETLLTFLSWLILFLLLKSLYCKCRWKQYILGGVIGFLSVWAYAIHARGVVVTILVFLLVFILRYWKKIAVVNIPSYLVGLIISASIDGLLSSYLKSNIWNGTAEYNSLDSILAGWSEVDFFFKGIKAIVYTIFGWLYSICVSSYGLAIIGLVALVVVLYKYIRNKEVISESEAVIYVFSGLYFLGSFSLGLIFMVLGVYRIIYQDVTTRLDQLIYFRYVMVPIQLLMFIAVYHLMIKNKWKEYRKKCLQFILIINSVFFFFISDFFEGSQVAILQLCGIPLIPPRGNSVLRDAGEIYQQLLILAVVNIVIVVVLYFFEKHIRKALVVAISALFVGQYIIYMNNVYLPLSDYYYDKIDLAEKFCEDYKIEKDTVVIIDVDRGIYPAQYKLYNYNLERTDNGSIENALIFSDDINEVVRDSCDVYYQIENDEEYTEYVLIKGKDLYERLSETELELRRFSN